MQIIPQFKKTVLNALFLKSQREKKTRLRKSCGPTHYVGRETESSRGEGICSRSHTLVAEAGLELNDLRYRRVESLTE